MRLKGRIFFLPIYLITSLTLSMKVQIMRGMNKLPAAKRVLILQLLCEGSSMGSE